MKSQRFLSYAGNYHYNYNYTFQRVCDHNDYHAFHFSGVMTTPVSVNTNDTDTPMTPGTPLSPSVSEYSVSVMDISEYDDVHKRPTIDKVGCIATL